MPVVAYVTRTFGSRTFAGPSQVAGDGEGGVGYVLRASDGRTLGNIKDIAAAQAAFARYYGNRILRWQRDDLQGVIEQWVAIGLPLDPKEIWPDAADMWIEPSLIPNSAILSSVATSTIQVVNDISQSGNPIVPSGSPTINVSDTTFGSKSTVSMLAANLDSFSIPTITALTAPYTMIFVANNNSPGIALEAFAEVGAGAPGTLFVGDPGPGPPAGSWTASINAVGSVTGLGRSPLPDVVVVEVDGVNVSLRLNGVDIGSFAGVPVATTLRLGVDSAGSYWNGRFPFFFLAGEVDPSRTKIIQTERYLQSRYP